MARKSRSSYARRQNRYSLIIVLFFIIFVGLGVTAAIMWPGLMNPAPPNRVELVNIPRVTTPLGSVDGAPRSVTAIFVVETEPGSASDLDRNLISENIKTILANGDYNMLTGRDSVEYAKELIREHLPGMMDVSGITELYLIDLQAGDPNRFFMDEETRGRGEELENFLRGIRFR